ncbi:MAG: hypothetical protein DRP27_08095 [Thermotogae bacterium]|nr:MAG: hypothetical protein DRP27_08095 [Thermotogota bacterium]
MKVVMYTSERSVSLQRVTNDIREVLEENGVEVARLVLSADAHPRNYEDCDACIIVMTFDPIWAKPFFTIAWIIQDEGLRTLFYTTVEGYPKRHIGDQWIYRDLSFIANSRYTKTRLAKVGARVTDVVYHGTRVEEIRAFSFMRPILRRDMGFKDDDFIVGYIAGAYRRKGHDMFAEAIKIVAKKDPNIKFCVITQPEAVPAYSQLENCVISDEFGQLSEDYIYGFYHMCDLYAQASLSEGFGLPVLEALASGTSVVHADYEPLSEITDEKCSFRVPVKATVIYRGSYREHVGIDYELHMYDPAEFAEIILQAKDEVLRDRDEYSARALERAKEFDIKKTYMKIIRLLGR